jgi:predicted Zn-dependent protease
MQPMKQYSTFKRFGLVALIGAMATQPVAAAERPVLIRDAETEAAMAEFADPIFSAAGLDPSAVHIYLLRDNRINAFVAGGQNLFLHTGLIRAAQHVDQLIGVMAHETGHISGGHLPRMKEAQRIASIEQIIMCTLGLLGSVGSAATGTSGGAGAMTLCGSTAGLGSLMKFSRTQESAADQAGMKFLDATGQSSQGMLDFLQILADSQKTSIAPPIYLQSHPLSTERMAAVRAHVDQAGLHDRPRADLEATFQRVRAKLVGYVDPLERVLRQYPERDNSLEARYARSIAYLEAGQIPKSLAQMDSLLADYPDDPYFNETKGDILYRSGKIKEAIPAYEAAVRAKPDSALLHMSLGRAQSDLQDPASVKASIKHLEKAVDMEPDNSGAWKLLGIAYGLDHQEAEASLALAESAIASGDKSRAKSLADRAMKGMPTGSPGWLRAQDISNVASISDEP